MLSIFEILKVIFLGIVEGITEWLPISSTGHMLLVDEYIELNISDEFKNVFIYVIKLGAILAVVILFWEKIFPFQFKNKEKSLIKKDIFSMWFKVVVACIPGAVVTVLFDDIIEEYLGSSEVIASMLIFYGIVFICVEIWNKKRVPKIKKVSDITYLTAFYIGLFQVLSIIPGTSRSGATIVGALIIGVSRVAAAEFTFFLAIPVMIGMSALKLLKYIMEQGFSFTGGEICILSIGTLVAFFVSVFVIKFLMSYIKKHDFRIFGWYRILLGIIVLMLAI